MGRGRVQAETGVTWTWVESPTAVLDLPEALVRVGLGRVFVEFGFCRRF